MAVINKNEFNDYFLGSKLDSSDYRINLNKKKKDIIDASLISVRRASLLMERDDAINFVGSRKNNFHSQLRNSIDQTYPKA